MTLRAAIQAAKRGQIPLSGRVLAFCMLFATPVLAGFNEGDSFGPSGLEMLVIGAFGVVTLPVGALLTYAGLEILFRAVLWFFGACLAVLAVAGLILAGELALILVLGVALLAVPAAGFFLLGGMLGRWARRRKQERTA